MMIIRLVPRRVLACVPFRRPVQLSCGRCLASEALPLPQAEAHIPPDQKVFAPKIVSLVDQIAQLSLLEVADLNELLKHRLNISDAPLMMAAAAMGPASQSDATKLAEEEESEPQVVQTSFSVKLDAFDASKKVGLIKEIKNRLEDVNLVQAKKFVESSPVVVKTDLSKSEADQLAEALKAAGGEVSIL